MFTPCHIEPFSSCHFQHVNSCDGGSFRPCHFERVNFCVASLSPLLLRAVSYVISSAARNPGQKTKISQSQPLTSFETRSLEMTKVDLWRLSGGGRKRSHARVGGPHSDRNFKNPYNRRHEFCSDFVWRAAPKEHGTFSRSPVGGRRKGCFSSQCPWNTRTNVLLGGTT